MVDVGDKYISIKAVWKPRHLMNTSTCAKYEFSTARRTTKRERACNDIYLAHTSTKMRNLTKKGEMV